MTSTNDGKELKSNETSSQKGKTYLIELHKSLDTRLSQDCRLSTRSELLKSAWQQIHTLCLHSTQNTHPYLLSWIQRHTAETVLQTEWQSPKTPDIEAIQGILKDGINHFIQECETAAHNRKSFPWETQLLQRAQWFKSVLPNPWGHPVLRVLLDPRGAKPTDEEVLEWLKEEHGVMFVCRVRQLSSSKSVSDLALLLAAAVMDRARADQQCDDQGEGEVETNSKGSAFIEVLTKEAGFTEDVWELLIDIELVLLHKTDRRDKCIERAKQTPLANATKLLERLQNRLTTSPREKKLWKNAKEVAILIAQVVLARCMVVPACTGGCRAALLGAGRVLGALVEGPRLAAAAAALAARAASARHLHALARALDAQCGGERKSFVCELYVRAITAGMNELEQLKLNKTKDLDARAAEQTLAAWFTQLGSVLTSSARIQCECILTAFSVHPSPVMYERIKALPQLQKSQEQAQEQQVATSEFGSWASDSRSQTNFVKTSETLNIKPTHQGNVLSVALFSEGEALGLAPELCQDLAVLLSGPRIKTLSWEMDREELLENCRTYMERTNCGTRALTTELKYLNLDPKTYQHLPEEAEDADDMYYGIEKGYEHLVEFQDSPPPEAMWQRISDFEQEDDTNRDSDFDVPKRKSKKKSKKQSQSSSDENEPLSLAEIKELKKKERPHSKERSQERKTTNHRSRSHSKEKHDKSQTKETKKDNSQSKERKKEKKKEKRPRKKKEKVIPGTQDVAYSSSLAQLIGARVTEMENQKSPIYLNERPLHVPLPGPSNDPLCPSTFHPGYNDAFLAHLQAQKSMQPTYKVPKPRKKRVKTMLTKIRNIVGQHVATPRNLSPVTHPSPTPGQPISAPRQSMPRYESPTPKPAISTPRFDSPRPGYASPTHRYASPTPRYDSPTPRYASPTSRTGSPMPSPKLKVPQKEIHQKPISDEVKQSITRLLQFRRKTSPPKPNDSPTIVTEAARVQALQAQMRFLLKHEKHQKNAETSSHIPQLKHDTPSPNKADKHTDFFDEFMKSLQSSGFPVKPTNSDQKSVLKPMTKVTPVSAPSTSITNSPNTTNPCAKPVIQQKKVDNAPNTFARLSYMHKNKQENSKTKPMESKETVPNVTQLNLEMDRLMANHKMTKLKHLQAQGGSLNQDTPKLDTRKTLEAKRRLNSETASSPYKVESMISTIPHQTNIKNTTIAQATAAQHSNVSSTAHATSSSTSTSYLSRNDQAELLMLLRQQNKLNAISMPQTQTSQTKPVLPSLNNLPHSSHKAVKPSTSMFGIACYNPTTTTTKNPPSLLPQDNTKKVNSHITEASDTLKPAFSKPELQSTPNILKKKTVIQKNPQKEPVANKPKTDRSIILSGKSKSKDIPNKLTKSKTNQKKPENWECVLNRLLAQKTPNRETDWGPNALDMALKKDTFKKPETKLSTGSEKANATPVIMKNTAATVAPASINPNKDKTEPVFSQETKKIDNKLSKKEDPFISGLILKSDYDLLEELMDEDLRKEIGEISSDEESYSQTIEKPNKMVSCVKQNVGTTSKDTQLCHSNMTPPSKSNTLETNPPNRNILVTVPQRTTVQNMLVIGNNITYDQRPSIHVETNTSYVVPTAYVVNNTSNVSLYQTQQIITTPVLNSLIIGQTVTIPVQANVTTIRYNYSNSINQMSANIATTPNVQASNMPTPEELIADIMKDNAHHNKPNANIGSSHLEKITANSNNIEQIIHKSQCMVPDNVESKQQTLVQSEPVQYNKEINISNNICFEKSKAFEDSQLIKQENLKIRDDSKQSQLNSTSNVIVDKSFNGLNDVLNSKPNKTHIQDILNTDVKENPAFLTMQDRKVLSEVQEKLTCPSFEKTDLRIAVIQKNPENNAENIKNQERIKQKRLAILNRQVFQKSCHPCISLEYAPLTNTIKVAEDTASECTKDNGDIENDYVLTPDSQEDVENKSQEVEPENNEPEPVLTCRRILLRSSNILKEKIMDSSDLVPLKNIKNQNVKTNTKEKQKICSNVTNKKTLKSPKHSSSRDSKSKATSVINNAELKPVERKQTKKVAEDSPVSLLGLKAHENIFDSKGKTKNHNESENSVDFSGVTTSEISKTMDKINSNSCIPAVTDLGTNIIDKTKKSQSEAVPHQILLSPLPSKTNNKPHDSLIIPIEDSDESTIDNDVRECDVTNKAAVIPPKALDNVETVYNIEDSDDSCFENNEVENVKKTCVSLSTHENTNNAIKTWSLNTNDVMREYNIQIQDISHESKDPNVKFVIVKLPNGKSLRVTIIGSKTVEYDTVLKNPEVKKFLHDAMNGCNLKKQIIKQLVPVQTQQFTSFHAVETVDLLSDDEYENNTLKTEFGNFIVTNFNSEDCSKHQSKLSQKCFVKIKRCAIDSFIKQMHIIDKKSNKGGICRRKTIESIVENKLQKTLSAMENNVRSDIIEIDDSTDEESYLGSVDKITEYKNMLLNDLQIKIPPKRTRQRNSKCVSKLQNSLDINLNSKCFVKLVRCDNMLVQADKNIDVEIIEGSSEENSSRPSSQNSFSILNDVPLLSPEVDHSSSYEIGRSSPVMEAFELMLNSPNISKLCGDTTVPEVLSEPLYCQCEYFETKRISSLRMKENNKDETVDDIETLLNKNITKNMSEVIPPTLTTIITRFLNSDESWPRLPRSKRKLPSLNTTYSKILKMANNEKRITTNSPSKKSRENVTLENISEHSTYSQFNEVALNKSKEQKIGIVYTHLPTCHAIEDTTNPESLTLVVKDVLPTETETQEPEKITQDACETLDMYTLPKVVITVTMENIPEHSNSEVNEIVNDHCNEKLNHSDIIGDTIDTEVLSLQVNDVVPTAIESREPLQIAQDACETPKIDTISKAVNAVTPENIPEHFNSDLKEIDNDHCYGKLNKPEDQKIANEDLHLPTSYVTEDTIDTEILNDVVLKDNEIIEPPKIAQDACEVSDLETLPKAVSDVNEDNQTFGQEDDNIVSLEMTLLDKHEIGPKPSIVETTATLICSKENIDNEEPHNAEKTKTSINETETIIVPDNKPDLQFASEETISSNSPDVKNSCSSVPINIFEDHHYAEVSFEDAENINVQSCSGIVNLRVGDKELVLKGVEVNDPEMGTRYYFPIDGINVNSDDDLIEVVQEVIDDDDDEYASDDYLDMDLSVLLPSLTYAKTVEPDTNESIIKRGRLRKRKLDVTDVKINVKKYRKGKNIDYPKFTSTAIRDSAYSAEYKRLMDYMTSVKFSYNSPFHKEYIDVPDLQQSWPSENTYKVQFEDIPDVEHFIFKEFENKPNSQRLDPTEITLIEEISSNYEDEEYPCSEQDTKNFSMGFGDGSGRVINISKDDGNISEISAATLSDVKQSQPLILIDEDESFAYKKQKSQKDEYEKMKSYINYIQMKDKVRNFFEKTTLAFNRAKMQLTGKTRSDDEKTSDINLLQELCEPDFIEPPFIETVVNVVQVGQSPVSAAAQNPMTCDPRVTQVSNASPSQCSIENSPNDDSQSEIKTEYTELTTAELTNLPLMPNYTEQTQVMSLDPDNVSYMQSSNNITHIQSSEELPPIQNSEDPHIHNTESLQHINQPRSDNQSYTENSDNTDNQSEVTAECPEVTDGIEEAQESREAPTDKETCNENNANHIEYAFNTRNTADDAVFDDLKRDNTETLNKAEQQNGSVAKTDQLAHAMNAAGITTTPEPSSDTVNNSQTHLVNILSQNLHHVPSTTQASANTFTKTTSINAMALQQALAQILPQALNQNAENNQNAPITQQVLHIVQSKNGSGNQITLLDNSQQSVINNQNTPVLHIVQNNGAPIVSNSGTANVQHTNSFSGLSLVDTGLQQGGNQLLHIVNTGNQKNNNAGQVLKRVNLLTNLTNMQGSNEQKMVQFVCKSADGKSIQLNAQHQRSMVLRLQPIETNIQTTPPKVGENEEAAGSNNENNKETNSQQEIKSRSVYEENYAKFIQNTAEKPAEKSNSLPKFNQAFGKQVYQDGNQKPVEVNTNSPIVAATSNNASKNTNCATPDNTVNLDQINQINSPPLLLRKSPAQTPQAQPNLVQQIKQTIAPMNIQTMHGGVIYTRQIPVNIGGGQTINLITVPSTELVDDQNQKTNLNQGEADPSIIKIVPQGKPATTNAEATPDENKTQIHGDNPQNAQPQPVLTQMRIKLPMLSKAPNMVAGTRLVRPSFFQIQRNVIGGANQPVYQQLVLTAAPPLGQQTIRLPQAQTRQQPIKVPSESSSSSESQMSSSTLEQLREFDMVLEQVKERSTVQPNGNTSNSFNKIHTTSTDTTDSSASLASSTSVEATQQVLYSIGNNQSLNVAYVSRKSTANIPTTSTFSRSPDSTGNADSPSSSSHVQLPHTSTSESTSSEASAQPKPAKVGSRSRSRPKSSSHSSSSVSKMNNVPPKTSTSSSTQKPLEDEQTTQRILYILAEYKEQVENSPDKDKPAPRRRSHPPSNPGSSKRKKSGSRRSGGRDTSPVQGDDTRTMGSEDSSCGTSQGDCTENCLDSHSPQDSPRKVARKLTFDQDTSANQARPQPQRNVLVADGQTITVARGTAGKPATAVLMPANYILPVSMVKGGQQIAIVTNRGPKLLTVGGGEGTTNALLLQRLIGPAGLKPVLRPGVRHVRLPTAALHNLQAFNLSSTATTIQPPDSTASPAPAPTPPELIDTRATSSPWTERDNQDVKPDRGSSPESSEPWHLPSSADYNYEETVRTDNLDRTVLDDAIQDRYSPDMEAQRIFDKMFELDSKKSYILDSQDDSPRCGYDIDASDDDKGYQVVHRKEGTAQRHHRLTHVSAAALRHKYAILEHELRLQKSLSEECEDLGVDSPSAAELFPEAELLFAASPAQDHNTSDNTQRAHTPPATSMSSSIPLELEDQIARDGLVEPPALLQLPLSAIDHEEFARAHPNTTFHSEPTDDEAQPFTITGFKGRHITSTIFHAGRAPSTVLMSAPHTTVISHPANPANNPATNPVNNPANNPANSDIDNMIDAMPTAHNNINLASVLVKDDRLTRFDAIMSDNRELHLSNTPSAIIHSTGNATQVIRRVRYDKDKPQFLLDDPDAMMGDDTKMAEDSSRDATMESMADRYDGQSSPERHTELFWESNSERSDSRRPLDYSSDSDKCCKSPSLDETNSTDSSGIGAHMRLDSVIKEARNVDRSCSAESSAEDTHPPLRTYPPKRMYHNETRTERSLSGKTRAGERSPDSLEVRRRASVRGVVKRGCHCCNGSPAPTRPKKSRPRKPNQEFTN